MTSDVVTLPLDASRSLPSAATTETGHPGDAQRAIEEMRGQGAVLDTP
jgi:hypothetical protein